MAAGIGTGANYDADVSFGNITIKGGVVEAKGGLGGAGIGTGPVGCECSTPCVGKSSLKAITISRRIRSERVPMNSSAIPPATR